MGGGFGGYGNTIAGYTRQNQEKGGAIIGKQINGLGPGVPRSWIGQKYNYKGKYNDIDSFLQDFNNQNTTNLEDSQHVGSSQDLHSNHDMGGTS